MSATFEDLPSEVRSRIFGEAYRLAEEDARRKADGVWAELAPLFRNIAQHERPKISDEMWRRFRADHAAARSAGVTLYLCPWFCSVVC